MVYNEGLHVGYRRYARSGERPAYPFGHGLGYTTWSLTEPRTEWDSGRVRVHVAVTNTGDRRGRHVTQAYLWRPTTAVERPALWFAGAAVSEQEPGGSATVTIDIPLRLLEHWDETARAWRLEPGAFEVRVGGSSVSLSDPVSVEVGRGTASDPDVQPNEAEHFRRPATVDEAVSLLVEGIERSARADSPSPDAFRIAQDRYESAAEILRGIRGSATEQAARELTALCDALLLYRATLQNPIDLTAVLKAYLFGLGGR